jgi:hypothetical protein
VSFRCFRNTNTNTFHFYSLPCPNTPAISLLAAHKTGDFCRLLQFFIHHCFIYSPSDSTIYMSRRMLGSNSGQLFRHGLSDALITRRSHFLTAHSLLVILKVLLCQLIMLLLLFQPLLGFCNPAICFFTAPLFPFYKPFCFCSFSFRFFYSFSYFFCFSSLRLLLIISSSSFSFLLLLLLPPSTTPPILFFLFLL